RAAVRAPPGVLRLELFEQHDRPSPPGELPGGGGSHDPAAYDDRVDPLHPARLGAVEASRPKPVTRRRELAVFAVPMVLLAIGANIGNAFAPTLITDEPAVLLALAPR